MDRLIMILVGAAVGLLFISFGILVGFNLDMPQPDPKIVEVTETIREKPEVTTINKHYNNEKTVEVPAKKHSHNDYSNRWHSHEEDTVGTPPVDTLPDTGGQDER